MPRVSATKNVADLNTAGILQDFKDIRGGLYGYFEMPRVGLAYLPPQGAQTSGKLYFSWAEHLDEESTEPTHGWCELDLANPQSKGIWRIGGYRNYVTADYMFEIPSAWAGAYTPGYRLVTGRYRDGGQAAQGPALFTFGPWNQGNPPANGTTLSSKPLLLYNGILDAEQYILNNYSHADEWNGGAWLTAGSKSAVVLAGAVPHADDLMPEAGRIAADSQRSVRGTLLKATPDIRQDDGFNVDHLDVLLLDPLVGRCHCLGECLVLAHLEERRSREHLGDEVTELDHA